MLNNNKFLKGVGGLVFALTGISAHAAVLFDIDGSDGAYAPTTTNGIDIFPGNALAVGSVPTEVGRTFELHYQAEVNIVTQNGGLTQELIPIGGDNSTFEITVVATLTEEIQSVQDPDGDGFFETVTFTHSTGTFAMYYDSTPDADDLTGNSGTGYDDGILIASGTIQPGSSNFTIDEELDVVSLDSFGSNDLPNVQTLDQGFGAANIIASFNITSLNQDFFPNLDLDTLVLNTTLETPFDNNNPSLSVGGVTPNYGTNNVNGLLGEGDSEDFHFEVDGNASFRANSQPVPLPGSLALLGLGLAAFSIRRRA